MSIKQDQTHVRTAEQLEQKHNWGKRFSEVLGLIDDTRDHVDEVESGLRNEITQEATAIRRDTQQIVANATKDVVRTSDFEEYKATAASELKQTADGITAKVEATENEITKAKEDISGMAEEISGITENIDGINGNVDGINADIDGITANIETLQKYREESSAELEVQAGRINASVARTEEMYTEITGSIENTNNDLAEEINTRMTFQTTTESEMELLSDSMNLRFEKTEKDIIDVDGKASATDSLLSKYFEFGTNGLTIKSGENQIKLRIDNGMIAFYNGDIDEEDLEKNRFGYWDGDYFHTGNIVVKLNERAQLGNFAYVPRSDGSLDFLKVGG